MRPLYAPELLEQRLLLAVLYVDVNAPGPVHDGSAWDSAYVDLQQALGKARAGDQICIAGGTYKPTTTADRTKSFQLKSGVALYGGYGGHAAADPDLRDLLRFPTILSGEIGDPTKIIDNSYHVLYAQNVDSTAILDGLTITAGYATGTYVDIPESRGGGMYNSASSPTLTNCTFIRNVAAEGGGMCNTNGSSPAVIDCTFIRNRGWYNGFYSAGGGMYNDSSSPTLTNCTFNGNYSWSFGGGIYNSYSSSLTLANCLFSGNSAICGQNAAAFGGGMYDEGSSTLTNCTFSGNLADHGGGMDRTYSSTAATLVNCIFWGNAETRSAGGGQSQYHGAATITHSLIQGGWRGVGNLDADPQFVRNPSPGLDGQWGTADDDYGDLRLRSISPALNAGSNDAISSTIVTDLAGQPRVVGGCVDMGAYETPEWPATVTFAASAQQAAEDAGIITVTLNLSQPLDTPVSVPLILGGTATLDSDYRLLDPNPVVFEPGSTTASCHIEILEDSRYELGETLMLHLGGLRGAWCGDIATHTLTIEDNDGPPVLYVDSTAKGNKNGSSWANAYPSLQAALQAVQVGAVICVAAGTYTPGMRRTDSFQLRNHVAIYGGFPKGGGTWQQRNPAAHPTILSGEIGDLTQISDNSYNVVYSKGVDATAILDGMTITGCEAAGNGAMCNLSSSTPTVRNCVFTRNSGSGMYNNASAPTLLNCIFIGNSGRGMYNMNSSSPTLTDCSFIGNSGMSPYFAGGGIFNDTSSPTLINCTFNANSAGYGGGMYNSSSSPTLINCTFNANSASYGSGMWNSSSSSPKLINCIVWGSTTPIYNSGAANKASVTYSLILGGYPGLGNLDADPQFLRNPSPGPDGQWGTADDDYGDLRLRSTSPALNAGNNAALPSALTTDLAGKPRLVGGAVDLGAYEYQNDELALAGATGDSFHLRIIGSSLEVFRNTQPDQAPPTQSIPLSSLTRLRLQGGQYTLASNLAGLELYLESDSQVKLASSQRLALLSLSPTTTLDLADQDLIVSASPEMKQSVLAAIASSIKAARGSDGQWLGTGLTSSAAKANRQTGLAVMLNEKNGKPILTSFDGQSVTENDILVKYTWNGDVNFDGKVDIADYFLVDSGFITQPGGYRNGDLNFDGQVDIDDYFLIDGAFIAQAGVLAAEVAPAAVAEVLALKAATATQPQPAPSVLAQLFSVEPVL